MIYRDENGKMEFSVYVDEFIFKITQNNDFRIMLALFRSFAYGSFYVMDFAKIVNYNPSKTGALINKTKELNLVDIEKYREKHKTLISVRFCLSNNYFRQYIDLDMKYGFDINEVEEMYYKALTINESFKYNRVPSEILEYFERRLLNNEHLSSF